MESEADRVKIALEKDTFDKQMTIKHVKPTDRVGIDGFTLIHWACYYGRFEVIQHFLLTVGAMKLVSVVDKHGWTPLHICAIKGWDKCLQLLIENGGDVLVKEHRGYTCGHCAAIHGHTIALQYILDAGHDINLTDTRSWTVVHLAAYFGRYQTLQMLVQLGGDLLCVDLKGNLPAHLSASEGHLDCLKLLVYYNNAPLIILKARNNKGALPKDLSIQFQKSDCADFLALAVKQEENDNDNYEEEYPAHYAASTGDLQILISLISEGHWDINEKDKTGCVPAHKAAGTGQVKCLKWLMNNGADISLTNNLRESVLDVAKKYGKTRCIAMIEEGIGLEQSCNSESIEQARLKIIEIQKMLEMSKKSYQQLGGVIEEEDKHEKQIKEITERHTMEISDLRNKLELEREKRETLEREADILRLKLHQTNDALLHCKATLPNKQNTNNHDKVDGRDVSLLQIKQKQRRRTQSAVTTAHKRTGGAYIDLKP